MPRFQYVSDTHIDLRKTPFEIEKHGDVLLLAGDIGNPYEPSYEAFLKTVSDKFEMVYVIAGNHEYYGYSFKDTEMQLRSVCNRFENVCYLQCDEDEYDGVRILGCTLWSDLEDRLITKMNDFYCIFKDGYVRVRPSDIRTIHKTHVEWLDYQLSKDDTTPTIVITHHAPDMRMNGKFCGGPLQTAFATDLPHLLRKPVVAWINGHTHQNLTIHVNGIPCVANCVGYEGEGVDYNPQALVDVPTSPEDCCPLQHPPM